MKVLTRVTWVENWIVVKDSVVLSTTVKAHQVDDVTGAGGWDDLELHGAENGLIWGSVGHEKQIVVGVDLKIRNHQKTKLGRSHCQEVGVKWFDHRWDLK